MVRQGDEELESSQHSRSRSDLQSRCSVSVVSACSSPLSHTRRATYIETPSLHEDSQSLGTSEESSPYSSDQDDGPSGEEDDDAEVFSTSGSTTAGEAVRVELPHFNSSCSAVSNFNFNIEIPYLSPQFNQGEECTSTRSYGYALTEKEFSSPPMTGHSSYGHGSHGFGYAGGATGGEYPGGATGGEYPGSATGGEYPGYRLALEEEVGDENGCYVDYEELDALRGQIAYERGLTCAAAAGFRSITTEEEHQQEDERQQALRRASIAAGDTSATDCIVMSDDNTLLRLPTGLNRAVETSRDRKRRAVRERFLLELQSDLEKMLLRYQSAMMRVKLDIAFSEELRLYLDNIRNLIHQASHHYLRPSLTRVASAATYVLTLYTSTLC
jgi:hypothetical protein